MERIPDYIETHVTVRELLSERTATVELPNGLRLLGYLRRDHRGAPLAVGQNLRARLNVADFARAELRGTPEAETSPAGEKIVASTD
ncbi:MAG: hypothetical protein KDK99_13540 [Verrucomicrobiales bacterium]|nr:hypothetical protein [Verrucomicrobiales bacterium]